ncbi:hypothetical protein [uncultured Treponema sp.]|uniref:hypothetical protein n=1 Tax=uncultured Treponema sp. TaxID=162155 RepID=UPI0025EF30B3|nr:hypothetical protein [uncultured Treponema sp.]
MKRTFLLYILFFFSIPIFAQFFSKNKFRDLQVKAHSEIFFTQTENCYALELPGVDPSLIQMELPELPLGTKFISSKKEGFRADSGELGTVISLWFNFAYSGVTRIPPLLVKIKNRTYYFEFEKVMVHENPSLISPVLEIVFENPKNLISDKKTGRKTLKVRKGEKISFVLSLRYAVQVLDFSWKIPKDSIFTETERFDFANGITKITQFTGDAKNLSRFDWQILKDGTFSLPEISVRALAYNGSQKELHLNQNIALAVSGVASNLSDDKGIKGSDVFSAAFEKPSEQDFAEKQKAFTREDCEIMSQKERRSLMQKLFGKKYAVFSGGEIYPVPEKKSNGQAFSGGQKVKVSEQAGEWAFVECNEFSGWTLNENLFEIRG